MLQNYQYFLALVEEKNISKAADKLFVSHQCLSKYLKGLENHYGVSFFNRKPSLSLTPAGQIYYESIRQLELLESNLDSQLADCHNSNTGVIRVGATETRFRILIPDLLVRFQQKYPNVELITECGESNALSEMIINNQLDMMISSFPADGNTFFSSIPLVDERLYLVISDNLLKKYFPESFPECRTRFQKGVDLRMFQHVPFIMNQRGYSSRNIVDDYTNRNGISLKCAREVVQAELRYLLAAKDYAACFCFSMFLPGIADLNRSATSDNRLNIFPLAGFETTNPIRLFYLKNRIFPAYGYDLISLVKEICQPFKDIPR